VSLLTQLLAAPANYPRLMPEFPHGLGQQGQRMTYPGVEAETDRTTDAAAGGRVQTGEVLDDLVG
jgi:hypothetical protein